MEGMKGCVITVCCVNVGMVGIEDVCCVDAGMVGIEDETSGMVMGVITREVVQVKENPRGIETTRVWKIVV